MNQNFRRFGIVTLVGLLLLFIVLQLSLYVVDQRELAVVLQFGKPVRQAVEPGIYFKVPFVETVRILPSTLQFWGDDFSEKLPDLPTKDDKKIELIPWAVWKINDPIAFVSRLRTMENAEQRVAQFTRGAMRDVITQFELSDLVRSSNREMKTAQLDIAQQNDVLQKDPAAEGLEMATAKQPSTHFIGRGKILETINADARQRMAASTSAEESMQSRGIELVDVGISHIDFVDSVRMKTFERWKAERDAISTRIIKLGEEQKQQILNLTNAEVERIQGEGQRSASETRGRADAEVIKSYADGIAATGEFYTFVRTLQAYEKALSNQTQLILTTDNDFLQQLKHLGKGDGSPALRSSVINTPAITSPASSAPAISASVSDASPSAASEVIDSPPTGSGE
jgi:membrane protease subunit HflC